MIYVRGDTHRDLSCFSDPALDGLGSSDKLIILGDFGFLFHGFEDISMDEAMLDALARKPYEILFLDGNHENFDALETYPEVTRYGAPVRRLRPNIFWLQRGYVYTMEEKTFFVMGGGYSMDKAWRLANEEAAKARKIPVKLWYPQEMPTGAEYHRASASLAARDMAVDYILTHTAPDHIIYQVIGRKPDPHEAELDGYLHWVYDSVRFKKWYFGHLHEDRQVNDQMIACLNTLHLLDN